MTERKIELIDLTDGVVIYDDGNVVEITNYFDSEGDDCLPTDDVVSLVAGPDLDGNWLTIDMAQCQEITFH